MLSLPFVERDSNVGEEPGLEREGAQEQLGGTGGGVQGGMYVIPAITTLCPSGLRGVDSRSTSASCVGSNPTGVSVAWHLEQSKLTSSQVLLQACA